MFLVVFVLVVFSSTAVSASLASSVGVSVDLTETVFVVVFKENTFDIVSMAFGLRNVTDKKKTLTSIIDCLKPGGKLVVLEFSKPENEILREIYDLYSFEVIPKLGSLIAQSEESYLYLAESIKMHPNQEELKVLFEECGFENCNYQNLTNGIVAIHTGTKSKE